MWLAAVVWKVLDDLFQFKLGFNKKVSHSEPADWICYRSVNNLARPSGNKVIFNLCFMKKHVEDCIKLVNVPSFSTGKCIDKITNNVAFLIWIQAKDLRVAEAHLRKSSHKSLSLFETFTQFAYGE